MKTSSQNNLITQKCWTNTCPFWSLCTQYLKSRNRGDIVGVSQHLFPPAKTGNSGAQKNGINCWGTASVLQFCPASLRLQWFMVQRRQILPGRGSDILPGDVFVKQVL